MSELLSNMRQSAFDTAKERGIMAAPAELVGCSLQSVYEPESTDSLLRLHLEDAQKMHLFSRQSFLLLVKSASLSAHLTCPHSVSPVEQILHV